MTLAEKIGRKTRISHLLHTGNITQTQRQTVPQSKGYGKGPKKHAGVAILLNNITFQKNKSEESEKNTTY